MYLPGPIDPDDLPDDHPLKDVLKARLSAENEQMKAHQLQVTEIQHQVDRFFRELPIDHLVFLHQLLHDISHMRSDQGIQVATFYQGKADAVLRYVHNVCPNCGENHDERDLQEMLEFKCVEPGHSNCEMIEGIITHHPTEGEE